MPSLNTHLNNIVARLNSQQQQMTAMAQELRSASEENRQLKERLHQQEKDMKEVIGDITKVKKDIEKDIKDVKDGMVEARDDIESLEHRFYVPAKTFEFFPKLPPKIRREIWKSDAFGRIIQIQIEWPIGSVINYRPPFPVLFQICSESRKLAFKLYTNIFEGQWLPSQNDACDYMEEYPKNLTNMFQPNIDTVLLYENMFQFPNITVSYDTKCKWKGYLWPLVEIEKVQSLAIYASWFGNLHIPGYRPLGNGKFQDRHNHLFLPQLAELKEIIWLIPEDHYHDHCDDWPTDGQEPPVHKWIQDGMQMWTKDRPTYKLISVKDLDDPHRKSDFGVWTLEKHADCPYCRLRDNGLRARLKQDVEGLETSTDDEGVKNGFAENGGLEKQSIGET